MPYDPTKTYYIKTTVADDYMVVSGVLDEAWRWVAEPREWRAEPSGFTPGTASDTAGNLHPASVPVYGTQALQVPSTGFVGVRFTAPDSWLKIPPRQYFKLERYHLFASAGQTIPTLVSPAAVSSINTTSDVITTTAAHNFTSGQLVFSNQDQDTSVVIAGQIYVVSVVTTTTLTLSVYGGAQIDFASSTVPGGMTLTPVLQVDAVAAMPYVKASWEPHISTTDPRTL